MPEATHIILTYPSQDTECMFRACDGMMIAERQHCTVIYGENPNAAANDPKRKQSRVFLESDPAILPSGATHWNTYGSRYLREVVAQTDLENCTGHPGAVIIDERCQEGSVILAPDSLDMRTNGGGMAAVDMKSFNKSLKAN